jgi:hypothetical protein
MAPSPFTPEQIRTGCPSGRTVRWRAEDVGEPPYVRVSRFLGSDEEGTTLERSRESLDGAPLGEPVASRQTWSELQVNALFPAAITEVTAETIPTDLGDLDCVRYTVSENGSVNSFWFDRNRPGPPVRYEIVAGGQVVSQAMIIADE